MQYFKQVTLKPSLRTFMPSGQETDWPYFTAFGACTDLIPNSRIHKLSNCAN